MPLCFHSRVKIYVGNVILLADFRENIDIAVGIASHPRDELGEGVVVLHQWISICEEIAWVRHVR